MNLLYENVKRIKKLMDIEESEDVDSMDIFKGEINQDPIQVQGPDGMDESDLSEQDDGGGDSGGSTSSSSSYPAIEKWASGVTAGPGNPRGNEKWTWKGTTGKANPKDDKKKWTSGRTFGPTGKYLGAA